MTICRLTTWKMVTWQLPLLRPPDFDIIGQQPAVDGLGGVGHESPAFKAGLLEEPGQSSTVIQVETEEKTSNYKALVMLGYDLNQKGGIYQQRCGKAAINDFKKTVQHMSERMKDWLADEQQVYLGRVDQIYVREGIHSLQARVDTTVQLPNKKYHFMNFYISSSINHLNHYRKQ